MRRAYPPEVVQGCAPCVCASPAPSSSPSSRSPSSRAPSPRTSPRPSSPPSRRSPPVPRSRRAIPRSARERRATTASPPSAATSSSSPPRAISGRSHGRAASRRASRATSATRRRPPSRRTGRSSRSPRRTRGRPRSTRCLPRAARRSGARSTGTRDVVGFAPDGALLYATRHYSTLPATQLFRLDLATGDRTPLPLAQAADGCFGADGPHALLHAPAVPGQPHEALPGRHGADAVEVRGRRRGGRAADGRLPGHEQVAHVLERARVLPQRPRRHHERLVDGRGPATICASTPGRRAGTPTRRRSRTGGSSTTAAPTSASSTSRAAATRRSTSASPRTWTRSARRG